MTSTETNPNSVGEPAELDTTILVVIIAVTCVVVLSVIIIVIILLRRDRIKDEQSPRSDANHNDTTIIRDNDIQTHNKKHVAETTLIDNRTYSSWHAENQPDTKTTTTDDLSAPKLNDFTEIVENVKYASPSELDSNNWRDKTSVVKTTTDDLAEQKLDDFTEIVENVKYASPTAITREIRHQS